ncbi:MAG: hypothetical protein KAQ75_08645 [Bacteroidales bacterium]|nr:hypothetical protein [Bacteroidales bacterium]
MNHKSLNLFFLLISLIFSNEILAQKEIELKLYYNFKYLFLENESVNFNDTIHTTEKHSFFGKVTPSIIIKSKKSVHEIEITDLSFERYDRLQTVSGSSAGNPISGYNRFIFNLNLKYEYIFSLLDKEKKYGIMLSPSVEPYIKRSVNTPVESTTYKTKQFSLGGKLYIIPRGVISFGKKFYFDFNVPIEIIDFSWNRYYIDNPSLPKDIRTSNVYDNDFFYNLFQFRLGFGIKL